MIYLDYSATTPIDGDALEVYQQISTHVFGNTSSLHDVGTEADHLLQVCRNKLATMLHVPAAGIYFTSGGTESNLLSIISLAKSHSNRGKHIITSMAEHASVQSAMKFLADDGFIISEVPFTHEGKVDLIKLVESIREDTIVVSIQHVNSEIGSIQPLKEISRIVRGKGILLHCDCVQSFGKLDLKEISANVDSLTISSHKIYGPKGVGAIYINPSIHLKPVFPGFHHEQGFRGGTINLPGIAAFVAAAHKATQQLDELEHYYSLRKLFLEKLSLNKKFTIYQSTNFQNQLPHIIGLGLLGIEGQYVMLECNRNGFAISTGSACQVGQQEASRTMNAMGIHPNQSKEFIRVSLGKETNERDLMALADFLQVLSM